MTTAELISNIVQFHDGHDDPTHVSHLALRRRTKHAARLAMAHVWAHRFWHFRWQTATVAVAAGVGPLPSDFLNVGRSGGVYLGTDLAPLGWAPLSTLTYCQQAVGQTGEPQIYSISGTVPHATAVVRNILTYPINSRNVTLVYERAMPMLYDEEDNEDATPIAASGHGLDQVPSQWHWSVLYEGTLYHRMKMSANAQSMTEQLALFRDGLKTMVAQERQGVESPHNTVPYGGGRF